MCGTPPHGGGQKIPKTSTQPHTLFFGGFRDFRSKKAFFFPAQKWSKNGPKLVKNGQNCPKIGEIIGGDPPENPNQSKKYRKNGQKRPRNAK